MKKVVRSVLAYVVVLALLAAMFTGCKKPDNKTAGTESTGANPTGKAEVEKKAETEPAPSGEMTEVGTPRKETLIVEC